MRQQAIKVGIADDHDLIRAGFKGYLDAFDDLKVVGEARDAAGALSLVKSLDLDVLLLDIDMPPGPTGLAVLPELRRLAPKLRVLVCSGHRAELLTDAALRAGAWAYLEKNVGPEKLAEAIRAAAL